MSEALARASSAVRFDQLCALVLDAVSSPLTKALYRRALDDFFGWWEAQGRPPFGRAALQAYRAQLECRGLSPSTINQRLSAVRKLAREAAANGLLTAEAAAGIAQVAGAKIQGTRMGNWLTREQAQQLFNAPDTRRLKGLRDRAALALLLGCGLRRAEAVRLTFADLQERDGRPVLVDLRGKHGRVRSVPVPAWTKRAIDDWTAAARITSGRLLRAVDRHGHLHGNSLSPQAILDLVEEYGAQLGLAVSPHDLRRTCAKLCRQTGGDLEQIQFLLGHASIKTTEAYLGSRQDFVNAPNDNLRIG